MEASSLCSSGQKSRTVAAEEGAFWRRLHKHLGKEMRKNDAASRDLILTLSPLQEVASE
jgi:hypothetical protein